MTRMRTRFLFPAAAAIGLVASGCAGGMAGGGGAGVYVWPAGTTVGYDITTAQVMTMEQPGMGNVTFTTTTTMAVDVEATGAERQFALKVTDASISSDAEAMGQPLPDVKALIGLESAVTLDERGLIVEATNLEGNAAVNEQGGPEAFREGLQALFLYMPEGGLGPGVEWTRSYSFEADQSGFKMNFSFEDNYICQERTTYEGLPAYRVTQTGSGSITGSGEQGGMTMDMDASGDGEATIYVEVGTGKVLMVEGTFSMSGGIFIEAAGMSIPLEMRITTTVKPKK